MSIDLRSRSRFVYFNLLDEKTGNALRASPPPREVTAWTGKLPDWGGYVVQVYLVRAAARRRQSVRFDLKVRLGR